MGNPVFLTDPLQRLPKLLFDQLHKLSILIPDLQAERAGSRNYIDGVRRYLDRAYGCNRKFIAVFCRDLWYLVDKSRRSYKRVLTVCHCRASGMVRLTDHSDVVTVHPCNGGYHSD